MVACIGLVLSFRSSGNLAAAYGVAITMTMVITTVLFYVLVRRCWQWSLPRSLLICGILFVADVAFLGANLTKIGFGGWFPLAVAGLIFLLMTTWQRGRRIVASKLRQRLLPLDMFVAELLSQMPTRVPGTAVFMSGNPVGTPPALQHNVMHNKVRHDTVVILTVETAGMPHIDTAERILIEEIGEGFWTDRPDVRVHGGAGCPAGLGRYPPSGAELRHGRGELLPGRESLRSTAKPGMARWREHLFVWMARNAQTATEFFNLPPDRVVEIGTQVEL